MIKSDDILTTSTRAGPGGANLRAAFRIDVTCPATLVADKAERGTDAWPVDRATGHRTLTTVTEDLSMTGVRVRLPAPVRTGARFRLVLTIADLDVAVDAVVRHSRADEFGAHAGMEFVVIYPQARAHITRSIAAIERGRLPNVRVMYAATCMVAGETDAIDGSTEECTPGFVNVLLRRTVAPTSRVVLTVTTAGAETRLDGTVVRCVRAGALWRAGIDVSATDGAVAAAWKDALAHLRASTR